MQKLSINDIKPGMVLAKPVMSDKGMPLCTEGTELTDKLIDRLREMNISTLTVKGHPVDTGVPDKTAEKKIQEMAARFAHVEGDPLMEQIRDAIASAIEAEAREMEEQEAQEAAP
ncbi:MAG TPA: hypothetical protein PLA83_09105 [Deltaproteobacteria bacterium]|jgi:CHASE3 domain sensor protein|nr:hypothetical protein [Deltaproteobacteria bacterium]HQI00060.1 hypothetical protein [Deltaproteobacteria bacterium]HQJ07562.1 hypothetical protein [Deltaproteobacteria bacterium]